MGDKVYVTKMVMKERHHSVSTNVNTENNFQANRKCQDYKKWEYWSIM